MPLSTQRSPLPIMIAIPLLLVLAVSLGVTVYSSSDQTSFNFIAIVIIFMASLTLSAVVFQGLRMNNKDEAFGLPTGSIRALLAIAIMILLVVFGLPLIQPVRVEGQPLQTITVPAASRPILIAELKAQNLVPVTLDIGATADAAVPGRVERPAKIAVYATTGLRSQQDAEFSKQLITAIITLLTSVVSFYFGAKSVSEATASPTAETPPSTPPLAPSDVKLKAASESFAKLSDEITKVNTALDELRTDPGTSAAYASDLSSAMQSRATIETKREDVRASLAQLSTDIARGRAATGTDQQAIVADVDSKLDGMVAAIASLETLQAAYAELVSSLYRKAHHADPAST